MIWQSGLILSYIGPDRMMTVASVAATILGGLLMCGQSLLRCASRIAAFLARSRTKKCEFVLRRDSRRQSPEY